MTDPAPSTRLRFVRVDPFAPGDVARDYELTGNEMGVLLIMAIQAEYRSSEWVGTLTDLAAATRYSRNTVSRIVRSLEAKGLIEKVHPFGPGHVDGRMRVTVHSRLVDMSRRRHAPTVPNKSVSLNDIQFAPSSDSLRESDAQSGANYLGKRPTSEVQRHGGIEVQTEVVTCRRCGAPLSGHTFDHEPVTFDADTDPDDRWEVLVDPEDEPF